MKLRVFIASVVGVAIMTTLFLIKPNQEFKELTLNIPNDTTISDKLQYSQLHIPSSPNDNPGARGQWEWQRLHDPATGTIPHDIRKRELAYANTLPKAEHQFKKADFTWLRRGPYNVGGRTRALAIDVTNDSVILAGGVSGGLWRSTNGGLSWAKMTKPNQHHSITCIAQDTRAGKTNTWYFGSGEVWGNSASDSYAAMYVGNGIYKSSDGGITWDTLSATFSGTPQTNDEWDMIWDIEVDASVDTQDVVYTATTGEVRRSSDGGKSWTLVLGGGNYASYFTEIEITKKGVIYATMSSYTYNGANLYDAPNKGLYRSADGLAWTKITPALWPAWFYRTAAAIDPSDENVVWFLCNSYLSGQISYVFFDDSAHHVLWKYRYLQGDGADSNGVWTEYSSNLPVKGVTVFDNFNSQTSYDLLISVKPGDSNTVFIGGTNLYRSADGFKTDTNTKQIGGYNPGSTLPFYTSYPNHHSDQHEVVFLPSNPNVMISASDGGLHKTTDCSAQNVNWTWLNNGYITTQFYTITIDHSSTNDIVVGGLQDNGTRWTNSTAPSTLWTHPSSGDGSYCAIANGGANYYFSHQKGRIVKCQLDNNGAVTAFTRIDPAIINTIIAGDTTYRKGGYIFIAPFILDPGNQNIMYLAEGKNLWRQNDLSQLPLNNKWDSILTGWSRYSNLGGVAANISAIAASVNPPNRLYFGTVDGWIYRIDSANTGDPQPADSSKPIGANVSCIAVDPRDADRVAVVYSNYNAYSLFYSTDGGVNWKKVAGNLETGPPSGGPPSIKHLGDGPSFRWLSIIPQPDSSTVYLLGTSIGLFSADSLVEDNWGIDSTKWVQQGSVTIGNVVVEMIDARTTDGLVAVATHGNGIYSTRLPGFTGINDMANRNGMEIKCFPNPAMDFTSVRFFLNDYSYTTLTIYDISGKKIKQIFNGFKNAGEHQSHFATGFLMTGLYIIAIDADGRKAGCKLLIQK